MGIERERGTSETARAEEEARWSEWMTRANAGDTEAYARLLEEIGGVMEQYLRRRFGEVDFVEDCVQECLLAIHRARTTFDPARRFRPWMFAIVRHKAIDMLRRRGTRRRHESQEADPLQRAAQTTDPALALQAAEALRGLAPEQRDALLMTKYCGYSLNEAARREGVSVTAMKSRVHRGIRQIKRILAEDGD
ncbi:MAG: sigma-70 family RNA polymerase sigma factor [Deltaproteobacteria bacterium]|jgi:RNA polymerase sigma-70 factor (ECF subfamily)|nr:sigma-70 family RNA polymerase sigma factor [Deltaproteobacteria bacterium]MBW2541639.1 sigma-70 family RNA polymerase sigma factor [Deltaproteobacteria bacterium]